MFRTAARFVASLTPIVFVLLACGREVLVGEVIDGGAPSFTAPDAALIEEVDELLSYCPSSECAAGHTTCPSSRFRCDVDLLTDVNNCGECGHECPSTGKFVCDEGRCILSCDGINELDCDGLPDNGCEAVPNSADNCGGCGIKCPDGVACVRRKLASFACGCSPGELDCGSPLFPCVDPSDDDANCGACGNACPPGGDGTTEPAPNTYFGCWNGECGKPKCEAGFIDCDGLADNGCETSVFDSENCGGCGVSCGVGAECGAKFTLAGMVPMCMCPQGMTFCGGSITMGSATLKMGDCYDLAADNGNCGGCGTSCTDSTPHARGLCVYGRCETRCSYGWEDCNGAPMDGCETNIASDPMNCGGCGIVCDGVAGQACVDGRCMVEPCDESADAGGPPR